jgi:hypothetical protein
VARNALVPLLAAILILAGCSKDEGPDIVRQKPLHIPPAEKDRLLAVLVIEKDKAWSFRMSGSESAVAAHREKFEQLLQSVKFGNEPPLKWTLPDGWKDELGGNEFRFATIKTGPQPKMLEVTVVGLPKEGGNLLDNVNRWRRQFSLPDTDEDHLGDMAKDIVLDDRKGKIVDLVGKLNSKKGPMQAALKQPAQGQDAGPKKIAYELPPGWVKTKPKNAVIQEQFDVIDGNDKLEATIVVLPAGAGGELANINRWREQIKLPPAKDNQELLKSLTKMETKAGPAAFCDLDNPKAPGDNRILGVIVPAPAATYFLKMMGPSEIVGRQKARFEAFAKSFNLE